MESKTQVIIDYASQLNLTGIKDQMEELIRKATEEKISYSDFSLRLLKTEINRRSERDLERRMKLARLPLNHDLEQYDFSFTNGLSKQQLNQLKEGMWLEQNFNIILMGPCGVGYVKQMIM